MASQAYLSPSLSQKQRFSREGFSKLHPESQSELNMANHDATVDIPLEQNSANNRLRPLHSTAALRPSASSASQSQSKHNFFRGRRTKGNAGAPGTGRLGYDGEEDTVTTMGKIYDKIFGFSIITRYFLYVLPLGLLIAVPIIIGAIIQSAHPKKPPKLAGVPLVWFFTWVEIVWLSLWVSKIVAHFLPWVFQLFVGVVSSGVRKYATVIRKLEIPLSLVGWAVTSLATFVPLMTQNPYQRRINDTGVKRWESVVQKILAAALVSSLVYLGEKAIIQMISINYHRKQFNAKIKESKRHVEILGWLYDASRAIFPAYCPEFAELDYTIADQLQLAALGGKRRGGHNRNGSATPMRLIQDIGRFGDKVTSAFGNVAQEITGKQVFNPNSAHSIVVEALERKKTSEALARRIWASLVLDGRDALFEDDLVDVFGQIGKSKEEADEAFWTLDNDANGDVTMDEMVATVIEWGRERKSMENSMVDVAQAINVLDRLLMAVVFVAIVFIFVAFLNANFTTTLATTGTALLSLSFVFSATAAEVLGSCIFLFVKHPFDIGDRVDIGNDQYTVEHISLLFVVFRRVTGPKTGQLCQYPNIVLNSLALENVSRSKAMTEQITLDVQFNTTFEDVQLLKNELKNFVTDKDNSRDFQPELEVEVLGTTDMSKMQLRVEIRHKSNWANEALRASRRSKFMCALVKALRAVPVNAPGGGGDVAGTAANPNFSVSISEAEAKENAKASAEAKDSARLVPVKKLAESKKEGDAIEDLTSRDPASDPARDDVAWSSGRDDSVSTLGGGGVVSGTTGGVGTRPSMDRQDVEAVHGIMNRANTTGKRKPSSEISRPYGGEPVYGSTPYRSISNAGGSAYAPPAAAVTPQQSQQTSNGYSTIPAPYRSQSTTSTHSPYQRVTAASQQQQQLPTQAESLEMSQIGGGTHPAPRGPQNLAAPPLAGTLAEEDEEGYTEKGYDIRPYSGV